MDTTENNPHCYAIVVRVLKLKICAPVSTRTASVEMSTKRHIGLAAAATVSRSHKPWQVDCVVAARDKVLRACS